MQNALLSRRVCRCRKDGKVNNIGYPHQLYQHTGKMIDHLLHDHHAHFLAATFKFDKKCSTIQHVFNLHG